MIVQGEITTNTRSLHNQATVSVQSRSQSDLIRIVRLNNIDKRLANDDLRNNHAHESVRSDC